MINEHLKQKLLDMTARDEAMRAALVETGELFDGYHPDMEAVHNENADVLQAIIDAHGWPTESMVGKDGAHAAWFIVQHAISKPDFQRACLKHIQAAVDNGEADPKWAAHLEDRIRIYEGRPQKYGTNFTWDENGELSPSEIEDLGAVDDLRRSVGLDPLSEKTAAMRKAAAAENHTAPKNAEAHEEKFIKWAKRVGWRP